MQNPIVGDGRSVPLESADLTNMRRLIRREGTKKAAAKVLGVGRNAFSTMLTSKTCSPATREKIRAHFEEAESSSAPKKASAA